MPSGRKARDLELLDALDALERTPFQGTAWRAAREGRDPAQGHPSAGRWDPGTFDVLYTDLEPEGAMAEIHFHLSRQPVFPSKIRYHLHELAIRTRRTLRLADMRALAALGVDHSRYREILYARTQEIGDAAHFLGFDGILAPSARWPCLNLTLFTDRSAPEDLSIIGSQPVDVAAWRQRRSIAGRLASTREAGRDARSRRPIARDR
jgi:RES domain-containing protein